MKEKLQSRLELAMTLAIKDVKIRYKNSALGFLWSLLTPLIYLGIFVTIFRGRFDIENYPLFALSGLIFWNYFNTTSNQIMTSVISSAGILKAINVPTLIFPVSTLISSLINLLLSLIPFFVLMLFFGYEPSFISLQLIPLLFLYSCFTIGFGLLLCSMNVFFRDVGLFWTSILPALFYFTPIVYKVDILPYKLQVLMKFHPIHRFLLGFRSTFHEPEWLSLQNWGILIVIGVGMLFLGYYVFKKLEKGFYSHY